MNALLSLIPRKGQMASLRWSAARFATMRWAALPITDRRWTAPLSAAAVGMGLFIGVAIGPGIDNSLGTSPQAVVMAPPPTDQTTTATTDTSAAPPIGAPAANVPATHASVPTPSGPSVPAPVAPITSTPAPTPAPAPAPTTTTTTTDETTTTEETDDALVFTGTVVHLNPAASSYVITTGKGQMNAVHAKKLPKPGTKLEVPVRELVNGTYAEDGEVKRSGSATSAKVQGIVTHADAATGSYTLSHKGISMLINADPAAQSPPAPPAVGNQLTVSVKLAMPPPAGTEVGGPPATPLPPPPTTTTTTTTSTTTSTVPPPAPRRRQADCGTPPPSPPAPKSIVTEKSRQVDIKFLGYSDFEGIVQGVCTSTGELVLSADDVRESVADITLPLDPEADIDLGAISPGDVVDASGTIEEDTFGLALTGISSDDGTKGAESADLQQGDQAG
jgi:hypothetical protein